LFSRDNESIEICVWYSFGTSNDTFYTNWSELLVFK
jgi:hypothetical protein